MYSSSIDNVMMSYLHVVLRNVSSDRKQREANSEDAEKLSTFVATHTLQSVIAIQ